MPDGKKPSKNHTSIVVVAEGLPKDSKKSAGAYIAKEIRKLTGLETRETILGYTQRGGSPQPPTVFWQRSLVLMLPN